MWRPHYHTARAAQGGGVGRISQLYLDGDPIQLLRPSTGRPGKGSPADRFAYGESGSEGLACSLTTR